MLDDDDCVSLRYEVIEHLDELLGVIEVEPGCRLIQEVECPAGRTFREFPGELNPLGLTARERGRALAELDVVEADPGEGLELVRMDGMFSKRSSPLRRSCPGHRRWTSPCI